MNSKKNILNPKLFEQVRTILTQARQKAYAAVNFAMVEAYWEIGRRIVEEEQQGKERAEYGAFLIKELSKQLIAEFGKGFTVANLKNFRQFYLAFPDIQKSYALRSLLTWSHYRLIMRVENLAAREYYIHEAAEQSWSTRQLERNINTMYYERLLKSSSKKALKQEGSLGRQNFSDFVKDPYVLEFPQVPEPLDASEREIETAIIDNLQQFLLEMGKGFSFVGRQFRISTETSHFYIDSCFTTIYSSVLF
jgi:predicted nuclease of restriction endonuclease-like (RecB) superfamily